MIRPQTNAFRTAIDLSGLWEARSDPGDTGEATGWAAGFEGGLPIAVPGSWNEQLAEHGLMNFVGSVWHQRWFDVPQADGRVAALRFGSADYYAAVWVDGVFAGASGPAMLPFELPLPGLAAGRRRLVARVDNRLPADGPTQPIHADDYQREGRVKDEYYPAVRFDFFPYGGLNRPLHLLLLPPERVLAVRLAVRLDGPDALADIAVDTTPGVAAVEITLGGGAAHAARVPADGRRATATLRVAAARLWCCADPYLHRLSVTAFDKGGRAIDLVEEDVGLRTVAVDGARLLLNGRPLTLKGFGKHEDTAGHGRGLNLPMAVRDFGLLRWAGANSARTSHYPYAEEFLDLADRLGILVIGELFSVNLDFRRVTPATLAAHKAAADALIARDGNRACVVAWSLANEPGYLAEPEYQQSGPYWAELFAHARAADPTRPLTHANVGHVGNTDPAFAHADILSINRYYGWYQKPGQIADAAAMLKADLDALTAHGKPLFVSEFGADAVAGAHAAYDQLFTEEYQADLIRAFWDVIADHPACIGGHVWNFADFRVAQHSRRVAFNLKGVFTRDRTPKRAAWTLRELWGGA